MAWPYSITTRADGVLVTSAIYMADHQVHVDNNIPGSIDDYSQDAGQKHTQTSPSSSATVLSGEIERIRYVLAALGGESLWDVIGGPLVAEGRMVDKAVAAVGTKKDGFIVGRAGVIKEVKAYSDVSPTVTDLIFDVNVNGTSIWPTTQGNRVKVVVGANAGSQTTIESPNVNAGDRITFDIDQIGTVAGGNWSFLVVIFKPTAAP